MTTQTRYVVLGGVGVVALGLLVGLAAYVTGGMPAVAVAQERPDEFRYVPAEASIVGFADVRGLMYSDFRERLRALEPESHSEGQEEFRARTGIDLENDIDRIVAGLVPDGSAAPRGIVVLTGRFDVARLEALARENGASVSEHQGRRVMTLRHAPDENAEAGEVRELTMAFVEPGVVALGSDSIVRQALEHPADGGGVGDNEPLMRLLSHIDEASNAWTIGRLDGAGVDAWIPDQVETQIPQVAAFAIGSRINGGISGTVMAETRDADAGRNLYEVAQGFLALARMQTSSRPALTGLLDALRLETVGANVTLSFDLPVDLLLELIPTGSEPEPADAD